jgi:serine/threonine-protein kinase
VPLARGRVELTLGPFVLLRRLAAGGMAEVYLARRAWARGFEKTVALKCIHAHLCEDPDLVTMFLDEARIAGSLSHPFIAEIHELGEADGRPYLSEEFVFGKDLRAITRVRGPWPLGEALGVARDVALALASAHRAMDARGRPLHIVHRDVTPRNILLSFEGAVKLIDFGIAKAAQRHTETQGGVRKGKVAYMSPEHVRGEPLDGRADLFSLGVVLYELCLGRKPFEGEPGAELALRIAEEPHPPARDLDPGFPEDVAALLDRALAKSPAQRFASGDEMTLAIEACLSARGAVPSFGERARMLRILFAREYEAGPLSAGEAVIPSLPAPVDEHGTPGSGATMWFDTALEEARARAGGGSLVVLVPPASVSPEVTAPDPRDRKPRADAQTSGPESDLPEPKRESDLPAPKEEPDTAELRSDADLPQPKPQIELPFMQAERDFPGAPLPAPASSAQVDPEPPTPAYPGAPLNS